MATTAATVCTGFPRVSRRPLVVGAVALGADDLEVLVELDVDLGAVVEGHLDLVLALLVVDLGLGDGAATGLRERGLLGLLELRGGDRTVLCVVVAAGQGGGATDRAGRDHGGAGDDQGDALAGQLRVHAVDGTSPR